MFPLPSSRRRPVLDVGRARLRRPARGGAGRHPGRRDPAEKVAPGRRMLDRRRHGRHEGGHSAGDFRHCGGRGVLLAGAPGVAAATVVILGGGVAGTNAAQIASGMGADVTVLDRNPEALRVRTRPPNCVAIRRDWANRMISDLEKLHAAGVTKEPEKDLGGRQGSAQRRHPIRPMVGKLHDAAAERALSLARLASAGHEAASWHDRADARLSSYFGSVVI
jgi:Alanine dehydrogenase/PNT, C-terminal domain